MDHARLNELSEQQKRDPDRLSDLEQVVVAYARWRGFTDEDDDQRALAKHLLDTTANRVPPEDWQQLRDYTRLLGPDTIRDLISYSLNRAYEDLKEQTRDIERLPDESSPEDRPQRQRVRRRDRDRER